MYPTVYSSYLVTRFIEDAATINTDHDVTCQTSDQPQALQDQQGLVLILNGHISTESQATFRPDHYNTT